MKDKSMRRTTILTTIVCLIPVVIGIILYPQLPETIATHWGADGEANGWSHKFVGAIVFPGSLAVLNLVFPMLLRVDPRYKNYDGKVKTLLQWIIPLVCVFASSSTLAAALGQETNVARTGPMFMGVIFIAIGNMMPKMTQSYTVGIKLPWTLDSEENWNRTHRFAGFLWVIGGFCMIVSGIFSIGFSNVLIAGAVMVIVPTIYSYLLYRKGI